MNGGFTLVGACGIGAISKLDGGSSWCDVETVSVMWGHMRRGSTIEDPVMFKYRKGGSCSNECTTESRRVVCVLACGSLRVVLACGAPVGGRNVFVFALDARVQVLARPGAKQMSSR